MYIRQLRININVRRIFLSSILSGLLCLCFSQATDDKSPLILNELEYFESRGINILVFSNWYNGLFNDSKMSGIEIIHHEVRTATNGDVRLSPTPGQWDPIPQFVERKVNREKNIIEAFLKYPDYGFEYTIRAEVFNDGLIISVNLKDQLPDTLEGIAGFNLEFLPSAYFGKAFQMDDKSGIFPLYPGGPMEITGSGIVEPKPVAKGKNLVLAPEDPSRCITIKTTENDLLLYDGRNKAQNGWFVVRSLIPPGKSGKVVEWFLNASSIPGWIRPPVITYSQVGYHPDQKKTAVIELDKNDNPLSTASLLKVTEGGKFIEQYSAEPVLWGKYLRYNYLTFDFSSVTEGGLYIFEYGDIRSLPFKIDSDVYDLAWQPTLDVFFPVQMDHMFVNEAYRVWHGAAHLDDALQAPVNHDHFDMYAQGPATDTQYKPGEHIPGLNTGGWFDAGDFDIRTQSQYSVVLSMVQTWETFHITRDETTVDQERRYADIHVPDGKPDLLQQIEHGVLALLGQQKAVGHAINGIIASSLSQYTHLGDAVTMTDNLVYYSGLEPGKSDGFNSGTFDDRWAFTSKSTPLNYGSAAALAAASRALQGYNDALSRECLATAVKVWTEEHSHDPDIFIHGNTTGGPLEAEELKAALELLICTKDEQYSKRINELLPYIERSFGMVAINAVRAIPYMDGKYAEKLKNLVINFKSQNEKFLKDNPFGVPVAGGGWAGSGRVIEFAITNYYLHKAFPDNINSENTFKGLNYIFGCHPGSNISFVSGVGTNSKKVAYGNNRADYSFIAGGVVPGVLILPPDFPENKEDWPFLWGENEYVITVGASYIFLVNAAKELSSAQFPEFPPENVTRIMDRDQMMWQLGISFPSLPPKPEDIRAPDNSWPSDTSRPDGNWTDAENHTITRSGFGLWNNYDESKTGKYTPIDLLKMKDGTPVSSPEQWWDQRRPEILKDVREELWGVIPPDSILPAVSFSVVTSNGESGGSAYIQKVITGTIDISRYPQVRNVPKISATLRIPASQAKPVPVMIIFGSGRWTPIDIYWNTFSQNGWGVCIFDCSLLQPDNGIGLTSYIIGLCNKGNWRKPADWGSLAAWSWGVSRLIDYFGTDPDVDAAKIGVTGHSRFGKATLVTMAYEPRVAIAFPSCSGSLGAKMNRRHWGQDLENSAWDQEYHWMSGNFFKWMGPLYDTSYLPRKCELMPVDAHSLLSLCAPRPVFVNGGVNDTWTDAYGMYLTCVGATPVYELLGRQGIVMTDPEPLVDVAYISGVIGYRYHKEGHTDAPDWPAFFKFASKFITVPGN